MAGEGREAGGQKAGTIIFLILWRKQAAGVKEPVQGHI